MSRLVLNRNGGSADEYGHLLALSRLLVGDIIEGFQVQALSSPGMSIVVGRGTARIGTGSYPTSYGYFVAIDTTTGSPAGESVTIATANASNPRIDTIVAYVDLSVTPSTATANNPNNMLKLVAVAGTAASTPVAPTSSAIQSVVGAANPYIVLGNIAVGTGVTQINSGNITDLRTYVAQSNPYRFSAYRVGGTYVAAVGTTTKLACEGEFFDPSNSYDTTNFRFVAPVAGFYQFFAGFETQSAVNRIFVSIYKNGSSIRHGSDQASSGYSSNTSAYLQLAPGDIIEVYYYVGSSANIDNSTNTYFEGYLVNR